MRSPLATAALACALFASACSNECQELGDRLCNCTPVGTTRSACERRVQNEIERLNPGRDAEAVCGETLETCRVPEGIEFCDWLDGRCGKAACGMSVETLESLANEDPPVDCTAPQ